MATLTITNEAVRELVKRTADYLPPYAEGVDDSSLTHLWSNLLCSYFPLDSSYLSYKRPNTDALGRSYSHELWGLRAEVGRYVPAPNEWTASSLEAWDRMAELFPTEGGERNIDGFLNYPVTVCSLVNLQPVTVCGLVNLQPITVCNLVNLQPVTVCSLVNLQPVTVCGLVNLQPITVQASPQTHSIGTAQQRP
ncbi:hypothetical protein E2P81_ATG04942 [Venturia nashicola]|nr:hypothetical protein E2P81_ATG04942 [Venturia nashicola]